MEDRTDNHHHHGQEEDTEGYYGFKRVSSSSKSSYYGCSFCKQGFTNAQALGGHMNIHRKHRVITKKKPNQKEEASMNKEFINNNDEFLRYYYSSIFQHINPKRWSHHQSLNEHDFDLTLQVGPPHLEHVNGDRSVSLQDGEVVDLELRLGHHPS